MSRRISVVLSQGQSHSPAKRRLEEDLVSALLLEPGIDVTVIPHLYDLTPDSTGLLALSGINGPMVVLSWLYPRAAHWVLDRNDIRGQAGKTLLESEDEEEEDEEHKDQSAEEEKLRVADHRQAPSRKIYCLDLRLRDTAQPLVDEIKRIANEATTAVVSLTDWIAGQPKPDSMQRFLQPSNSTSLTGNGGPVPIASPTQAPLDQAAAPQQPGAAPRRWYPVIDYSRCTNCMECIDFCLFGVYGVDGAETILVEQPDNCRKGCPACSRVCPENAIIFPQHKTPAIAGALEAVAALKIDLTKLFGAPDDNKSAAELAAQERDEQLVLAGREAVGMSVGMPRRQQEKQEGPSDELDQLIDQLDELDL